MDKKQNDTERLWISHYECPVCGEFSSKAEKECPFCHTKLSFIEEDLFLLSEDEYTLYKDAIPVVNTWWWLRSPGSDYESAMGVDAGGSVYIDGFAVFVGNGGVRPALQLSDRESEYFNIGDRFLKYDFPWVVISRELAIAEVPIAFCEFDVEKNDYEKSEVRRFLKEWKEERP